MSPANRGDANLNSLSIFLAGTVLGLVIGLVFASYLIKIGRISGLPGKAMAKHADLQTTKDSVEVVKRQQESVTSRKA